MSSATHKSFNLGGANDIFAEFIGGGGGGSQGSSSATHRSVNPLDADVSKLFGISQGSRKAAAIERKLVCSLEEVYMGARRKMRISRTVLDGYGKLRIVEEILEIHIKPGWKKGTKITFPEKGNQEPGVIPADMIFVVDEKPHAVFVRDGNDLVVNQKISLLEALTGQTLTLTTLNGRNLTIPVADIVKPGHEVVIPNEGMPISKEPNKKGDLKIKFDVMFPSRLTAEQKSYLKRGLGRVDN